MFGLRTFAASTFINSAFINNNVIEILDALQAIELYATFDLNLNLNSYQSTTTSLNGNINAKSELFLMATTFSYVNGTIFSSIDVVANIAESINLTTVFDKNIELKGLI